MNFHDPRFCRELKRIIAEFKPDVIVLDPWYSVALEDKQVDYLKALEALKQIIGAGEQAPALVIVAHTRKPSGENRASGRGLLHELSGSHVLGSRARTVYVIEAMSSNVDDDRIIFQCVKANDGQMPPKSFWHRRNGAFLPCSDISELEVKNRRRKPSRGITFEQVRAVFAGSTDPLSRKEAAEALMESTKFGRTAAFKALELGGRFREHLESNGGGMLSWKE